MPDDRVKHVTAVSPGRQRTGADHHFNFVERIRKSVTVTVGTDWSSCRRRRLVLLSEKHAPVHQPIDIAEAAALTQIQTGNGERLVGAAEQLDRVFVARIELEFAVQSVTGSDAPDSKPRTAYCDFSVAVQRLLEHELRPVIDRTGYSIAAMIEIDRGKVFLLRQNIGNAITMSGLHGGERSAVICPGIGIRYAGVSLRTCRHKRRLLPATARLRRPAPNRPLRPLEQRRQGARQLREIGLMRRGLRVNRVVAHCAVPSKGVAVGCVAAHRSPSLFAFKTESHRPFRQPLRVSDPVRAPDQQPAEVVLPRHHFRPVTLAVSAEPLLQAASAAGCEPAGPACRCRPSPETSR